MATGMAEGNSGLFWAFVWAEESAGGVCSAPGEWDEPRGREVMGMWYVEVPCNSDLLLRAAMVCEERNAR